MLVLALLAAGPARADTVLARGNPPLTQETVDRLIGFFELVLDGQFTGAQREEFRKELIADWHGGQGAESVLAVLELGARLGALGDDQRRELLAQAQKALLEQLRAQPDSGLARLLLAVHGAAVPTAVPAELVGTWGTGTSSSVNYVNTTTGSYAPPSGTQVSYTIRADGRYEYAALTQQSLYSCTTRLFTYKTGVVSIRGAQLTLTPKTSTWTNENTCSGRNERREAGKEQESYNFRIERDEYGVKLCLANASVDGCAYKR
jgi:hypothetical protein